MALEIQVHAAVEMVYLVQRLMRPSLLKKPILRKRHEALPVADSFSRQRATIFVIASAAQLRTTRKGGGSGAVAMKRARDCDLASCLLLSAAQRAALAGANIRTGGQKSASWLLVVLSPAL